MRRKCCMNKEDDQQLEYGHRRGVLYITEKRDPRNYGRDLPLITYHLALLFLTETHSIFSQVTYHTVLSTANLSLQIQPKMDQRKGEKWQGDITFSLYPPDSEGIVDGNSHGCSRHLQQYYPSRCCSMASFRSRRSREDSVG